MPEWIGQAIVPGETDWRADSNQALCREAGCRQADRLGMNAGKRKPRTEGLDARLNLWIGMITPQGRHPNLMECLQQSSDKRR